jgi:hypothetical protein
MLTISRTYYSYQEPLSDDSDDDFYIEPLEEPLTDLLERRKHSYGERINQLYANWKGLVPGAINFEIQNQAISSTDICNFCESPATIRCLECGGEL